MTRKYRPVAGEVDGIVAPFAGRDLPAVKVQDQSQFRAIEIDDF